MNELLLGFAARNCQHCGSSYTPMMFTFLTQCEYLGKEFDAISSVYANVDDVQCTEYSVGTNEVTRMGR